MLSYKADMTDPRVFVMAMCERDPVLAVRLVGLCARDVLPLVPTECTWARECVEAAEKWCSGVAAAKDEAVVSVTAIKSLIEGAISGRGGERPSYEKFALAVCASAGALLMYDSWSRRETAHYAVQFTVNAWAAYDTLPVNENDLLRFRADHRANVSKHMERVAALIFSA